MEWPFRYLGSLKLGGTWLLDGLWRRLGIQKTLQRLLEACHYQTPIERLLFAMVANRALAPSSKLAIEKWVAQDVYIDQLPAVEVHQLYRAMDFLLEAAEAIQREVFWTLANLFNLEVDVIFFDTTTAYFEIEGEDADGLRRWGHSADDHPKMAQVVIGLAVTRDGIPVRCWVWPGNTGDQNVVAEVKRDLNGWKLNRVVVVLDTGFNSEANRRILQGAGDHYIIGEKLRVGPQGVPAEALRRGGKYRRLPDGLEIKEVVVGGDSAARRRFVIVRNPEEAERDRQKRESILAELRQRLEALKQKQGEAHTKAACELRAHETFGRYLRQTRGRATGHRRGQGSPRSRPRREVCDQQLRRLFARRRPGLRLQATLAGGTGAPGPEAHGRRPADVPPARRPHPVPRAAVLAGPPHDPGGRERDGPDLATDAGSGRPHRRGPPRHRPRRGLAGPPPHRRAEGAVSGPEGRPTAPLPEDCDAHPKNGVDTTALSTSALIDPVMSLFVTLNCRYELFNASWTAAE
ncbi:IS1634 family transposase [Geochorda subterranea]|uniref:IS1634 family transposase n=1 Tax=Geochorda subterranea TaxID=3109564 RepID=A0ABZ1BPW5_9FIRM|nr:IS1634 family transposase [Limnochorda sp. LNt]WRP14586.1 IS1634 family transposase [Limnochorda sp. LNt]